MKQEAFASLGPATLAIALSLTLASCGGSSVGDCVTRYTDGDVLRVGNYAEQDCLDNCAARTAPGGTGVNVIQSCVWEGRREAALPLGVGP